MKRVRSIAVAEEAAAFRRGVEAALEKAGLRVVDASGRKASVVVASLRREQDCALVEAWVAGGTMVVALVSPLDASTVAHALHHGAAGVADWSASPERIVEAVSRAVEGDFMIPTAVAGELPRAGARFHLASSQLDEDEAAWLLALSRGATVVALADEYGYSERALFRRLHDLYARLGATNRSEAMVAAQRLGLLDAG